MFSAQIYIQKSRLRYDIMSDIECFCVHRDFWATIYYKDNGQHGRSGVQVSLVAAWLALYLEKAQLHPGGHSRTQPQGHNHPFL